MDSSLSDQLSQYFDHLLGDSPVNSQTITSKNHTGKPKKKYKHKNIPGTDSEESSQQTTKKFDSTERKITQNEVILDTDKKATTSTKIKQKSIKVGKGKQSNNIQTNNIEKTCDTHQLKKRGSECQGSTTTKSGERVTEDGFKIVSTIPEDDSDVSDAFEQDIDDWEGLSTVSTSYEYNKGKHAEGSSRGPRKNNDGFKIVTEMPPDDSDASDAFHEEDCVDTEVSLTEGCQLNGKKTIKKPILQLMNDFGFDDSIFYEKRDHSTREAGMLSKKRTSKKGTSNTLAELAKKKQQKEVMILDYSKKRGSSKNLSKSDEEENINEVQKPTSEQIMDEKELKRARYDVFKLGMSGFHKEKKEDTRVALAIILGAKPPKNKAVSYKDLLKMKKEEKQKKLDELDTQKRMGLKVTKSSKRKPKDNKNVKGLSLKLGTYRDGVQVLSKKDIAKINAS